MTPEEYIKAYTRGCSNELIHGGYHEWLTPENALAAAELAREEFKKDAVIIEDELAMCYNNGEPTGLSPYKEWWETPEVQNNFKDGDKVKVIIIKE